MEIRFGKVIDTVEELRKEVKDKVSLVVLFKVEDWFIEQNLFQSYGGERWTEMNPEEYGIGDRHYSPEDLFAIAEHQKMQIVALAPMGEKEEIVSDKATVSALPRFSIVLKDERTVLVNLGGEWWDYNDFIEDSNFYAYTDLEVSRMKARLIWAPKVED